MNFYWLNSIDLWSAVSCHLFFSVSCLRTASSFWDNFLKSLFDNNNNNNNLIQFWLIYVYTRKLQNFNDYIGTYFSVLICMMKAGVKYQYAPVFYEQEFNGNILDIWVIINLICRIKSRNIQFIQLFSAYEPNDAISWILWLHNIFCT